MERGTLCSCDFCCHSGHSNDSQHQRSHRRALFRSRVRLYDYDTHYRRREIIATTAPASGGQSDLTWGRTAADRSIEFTRCRRRAAQLMHGSSGPRESAPANGNSIGSAVLQRTLVCPTYKHATSKQTCHSLNQSIKVSGLSNLNHCEVH